MIKKCARCGGAFEAKHRDAGYCSGKCSQREWSAKNRERRLEYKRELYDKNRERRLEYKREYYAKNREFEIERAREWRAKYRATILAYKILNQEIRI
jgi:hypothetical protein